jgi:hypothetical protein
LRLSRVTGHDFCLMTSTSVMPYLANKPFSLAIIKGAASVRGINPSFALVVSTFGVLAAVVTLATLLAALLVVEEVSEVALSDEQP